MEGVHCGHSLNGESCHPAPLPLSLQRRGLPPRVQSRGAVPRAALGRGRVAKADQLAGVHGRLGPLLEVPGLRTGCWAGPGHLLRHLLQRPTEGRRAAPAGPPRDRQLRHSLRRHVALPGHSRVHEGRTIRSIQPLSAPAEGAASTTLQTSVREQRRGGKCRSRHRMGGAIRCYHTSQAPSGGRPVRALHRLVARAASCRPSLRETPSALAGAEGGRKPSSRARAAPRLQGGLPRSPVSEAIRGQRARRVPWRSP